MPSLLLAFEGPMQAWGSGSKFDNRFTENIPTKSGVIGLIAAAMGRKREEDLEDLNELKLSVRIDQPGTLLDDLQILTIQGQDPYLSHKFYLSDAKFLVAISHQDIAFLQKISNSIQNPVYPIYLGRRNCVPTGPIVKELVETDGIESLKSQPWLASAWFKKRNKSDQFRMRLFSEEQEGFRQFIHKDYPVSFNKNHRQYKSRMFSEIDSIIISEKKTPSEQQLDFFEGAEQCI